MKMDDVSTYSRSSKGRGMLVCGLSTNGRGTADCTSAKSSGLAAILTALPRPHVGIVTNRQYNELSVAITEVHNR